MENETKDTLLRTIGWLLGVGAIALMIASAVHGWERVYPVLKDWQTLATGILAIMAARWTVREMQASRHASEEDRRNQAKVRKRAATLQLEEMVRPLWRDVQSKMDMLEQRGQNEFDAIAVYNGMGEAAALADQIQKQLLKASSIALYHDSGIQPVWVIKHATAIGTIGRELIARPDVWAQYGAKRIKRQVPDVSTTDLSSFSDYYRALEYSLRLCVFEAMHAVDDPRIGEL